ncbi:hypothetical protein AciX9_4681 (plasmid) [Granulicella tundricola MP5ACTX9]|uniref:Uncharacterized protein n=1 Tax=Granulicella tundricola (strain ATCC BAA-1859 / DSM 23138 / MP5ACTX9) TaxID=1198114 RepID=E8X826_GRATM|nr:hypothetical protein AciX9_4681 [Granulicella tundricola MP5ACTX9]
MIDSVPPLCPIGLKLIEDFANRYPMAGPYIAHMVQTGVPIPMYADNRVWEKLSDHRKTCAICNQRA